jgi:hypothetical protein
MIHRKRVSHVEVFLSIEFWKFEILYAYWAIWIWYYRRTFSLPLVAPNIFLVILYPPARKSSDCSSPLTWRAKIVSIE